MPLAETERLRTEVKRLRVENNRLRLELEKLKAWPDFGESLVSDD